MKHLSSRQGSTWTFHAALVLQDAHREAISTSKVPVHILVLALVLVPVLIYV